MLRKIILTAMCLQITFLAAGSLFAEDEVNVDLTADFFGKYIWRGQNLTDEPVFQPGITIGYGGFSGGVWGNMDMTGENGESGEFTELDYFGGYSFEITEVITAEVGAINYHFPSVVPDTTELYWSIGLDMTLSPSVTVYHDIDSADGTYVNLGIGHTVELGSEMPGLELGAGLGWGSSSYNEFYWGVDDSALNDLALNASLPFRVGSFTIAPSVNYVTLLDNDIKDSDAFDKKSDYFYWGVSLSTSF